MSQYRLKVFCVLVFVMFHCSAYADNGEVVSLFSYTGYFTTPSAYIKDGRLGFHYSYLPQNVAVVNREKSDNWIFSSSLGFFPFVECYFSVYVTPSVEYKYKYGAVKVRSPGVKIKILHEKKWLPAAAVGVFDPSLRKLGIDISHPNASSTFLVLSKRLGFRQRSSVSLGYGVDYLSAKITRLKGLFGGINISFNEYISLLIDYDAENWSGGINACWHGLDMVIGMIDNASPAYRIGYNFNLLDK